MRNKYLKKPLPYDANGEMEETEEFLHYNFSEYVKLIHSTHSLYSLFYLTFKMK